MRSPVVWLVNLVIVGIVIFLYFRDTRMLVSRSPDGQTQITFWDRTDLMFDHDLRVTVNHGYNEQFLYTHLNDFCSPPREGHVIWGPSTSRHRYLVTNTPIRCLHALWGVASWKCAFTSTEMLFRHPKGAGPRKCIRVT